MTAVLKHKDFSSLETLEEKICRVLKDKIEIVPYDPGWPESFQREREHLLACCPADLIVEIVHFGSTAVPGLAAKPIVDILVEVRSLEETKQRIAPILEAQGYDYFWRPTSGNDTPPYYAWFIKRDAKGKRTHHIHMLDKEHSYWNQLRFQEYLIEKPKTAAEYEQLKYRLAAEFPDDRVAYTSGKGNFIRKVMNVGGA